MEHKATGACGCANCFTESMDDAFYCRDCEERCERAEALNAEMLETLVAIEGGFGDEETMRQWARAVIAKATGGGK